jgi:hypothetical protein
MRSSAVSCAVLLVACFYPTFLSAQNTDRAEPPLEPYHKHHDTRHGHDHFYPDRGAIVRDLPAGATVVNYAGLTLRFKDGVWFEPRGPAFMVVSPPIGLIVQSLPGFVTVLAHGGETYLYANDTYYQPRPDVGGYEVVNDPSQTPPDEAAGARYTVQGAGATAPAPASSTAPAATESTDEDAAVATPLPDATATAATVAKQPVIRTGTVAAAKSAVMPAAAAGENIAAPAKNAATGTAAGSATAPTPAGAAADSTTTPAASAGTAGGSATTPAAPVPPSTEAAASPPAASPPAATAPAIAAVKPPVIAPPAPAAPATTVAPSSSAPTTVSTGSPPRSSRVALVPRNGQSADQEARDRYDCYRFAVTQTGFDPLRWNNPTGGGDREYQRAQLACFEARGYSAQ